MTNEKQKVKAHFWFFGGRYPPSQSCEGTEHQPCPVPQGPAGAEARGNGGQGILTCLHFLTGDDKVNTGQYCWSSGAQRDWLQTHSTSSTVPKQNLNPGLKKHQRPKWKQARQWKSISFCLIPYNDMLNVCPCPGESAHPVLFACLLLRCFCSSIWGHQLHSFLLVHTWCTERVMHAWKTSASDACFTLAWLFSLTEQSLLC